MKSDPESEMIVARSVVVCCYTDARWDRLVAAVSSAAQQLDAGDEVIVVVDYNERLLEKANAAFGNVACVVPNRFEPGLSGARNTGVETARGSVVAFLDDDAAADAEWLETLTAPFSAPRVAGVGGRAIPEWANSNAPWWFPEEFYWVVGCSYRGLPTTVAEVRNPIGCNMAFRTDAMRQVGGFSATLGRVKERPVGGEETDLAIRVRAATGGVVIYEPGAVVHHAVEAPRVTWSYFFRRCFAEGRSKAVLARRVGAGDATAAERSYLRTLARGGLERVVEAIRTRSLRPIGQSLFLVAGLSTTTLGFVTGQLSALRRTAS